MTQPGYRGRSQRRPADSWTECPLAPDPQQRLPVVTLIDVPGAHPGPESEERGIAEAIAASITRMTELKTPIVTVVTGEGGSGGALAIAVGARQQEPRLSTNGANDHPPLQTAVVGE